MLKVTKVFQRLTMHIICRWHMKCVNRLNIFFAITLFSQLLSIDILDWIYVGVMLQIECFFNIGNNDSACVEVDSGTWAERFLSGQ